MDLNLQSKVVLITGGSKGIGRQVALTFAQEGANVAICARTQADLELAKNRILAVAPTCDVCTIAADLRSEAGAQQAVKAAVEHYGAVDILVNCAGAAPGRLLLDISDETWQEALALKFLGYVRMAKATVPHFLQRGHGVIVNVIGNDGVKPSYWELTGTAANAADLAVMQALADQYGRNNIRINSVNPGPVDTGRWDTLTAAFARDKNISVEEADGVANKSIAFGRICTPQEVANVVVFLASDCASFVHGAVVNIDGNQRKAIMDV
jgi:NAD(P)-dependent dehydrogenase (short-subunit alcohol dehydrogenase family)